MKDSQLNDEHVDDTLIRLWTNDTDNNSIYLYLMMFNVVAY